MPYEVLDVALGTGEKIVKTDDLFTEGEEPIAKMGAKEPSAARDKDHFAIKSFFRVAHTSMQWGPPCDSGVLELSNLGICTKVPLQCTIFLDQSGLGIVGV